MNAECAHCVRSAFSPPGSLHTSELESSLWIGFAKITLHYLV